MSGELEADHFGNQHVDRLVEHDGLSLDAANAPPHDTQAVDHRRVRVGADQAVRQCDALSVNLLRHHTVRQIFEVHLMNDAGRRGNHAEVLESALPPPQELVSLAVALELDVGVDLERSQRPEAVHLDRVVDHQIDRD